jgi:hypothetical protein
MTIDERLEAVTQGLELLALRQVDAEERHDREVAEIRRLATKTQADLRRAVILGVREARNERSRRRAVDDKVSQLDAKFDETMTRLAATQLVTGELLRELLGNQ